jgi:hypothetical protein
MAYALKYEHRASTFSGLDFLAGVWLFVSPFVLSFQHVNFAAANDVMFGMLIALFAVYRYMNPAFNRNVSWLIFALGIWILISPVACKTAWNHVSLINNVILGLAIIIFSAISATSTAKFVPAVGPGIYRGK